MSVAVATRPDTLDHLTETANREHGLVLQAGGSMVEHAIRAGDALRAIEEHVEGGQWERWLADNFADSASTARLYMRLSRHQDELRANDIEGITAARRHLVEVGCSARAQGL